MNKRLTFLALGLAVLPTLGCGGQKSATPAAPAESPTFDASDTVTAQVTVLAVDQATRMVTLKRDVGDTVTVEVGPEIKNLPQLKAGDVMDVVYVENLKVRVEPPGEPSTSSGTTLTTAKPGETPGATYQERTETKANITAIDKEKGTATLQTAEGSTFTVTPHVPENLDKVKIGDIVVFTHTQEVAVSAAPRKAAAHKKAS